MSSLEGLLILESFPFLVQIVFRNTLMTVKCSQSERDDLIIFTLRD